MSNPLPTQNRTSLPNPELLDALEQIKKDVMLSLNCHHLATIQSFDPATQTVTATINYKKTIMSRQANGVYVPTLKDYPIVVDAPIIRLKGGAAGLTMPIAAGDECILLFNDRDIDTWFSSGQVTAPSSSRLHSFSDAFALVGVSSKPNFLPDYDEDHALLFNGTTKVGVSSSKVLIANDLNTLNDLLAQLIQNVKDLVTATAAITVTCATPGNPSSPPINAAAINAVATSLTTTASDIAALLE